MKSPTTRTFLASGFFSTKLISGCGAGTLADRTVGVAALGARLGLQGARVVVLAVHTGVAVAPALVRTRDQNRARPFLRRCGRQGSQHYRKGNEHRPQNAAGCAFELLCLHCSHLHASRIVALITKEKGAYI